MREILEIVRKTAQLFPSYQNMVRIALKDVPFIYNTLPISNELILKEAIFLDEVIEKLSDDPLLKDREISRSDLQNMVMAGLRKVLYNVQQSRLE